MNKIIKKILSPRNLGTVIAILIVTGATALAAIPAYKSWLIQGTNLYTTGTNVGIGTTTPTEKLDVFGNIAIRNNNALKIFSDGVGLINTSAPGAYGTFDFYKTGDLNASVRLGHSNFPPRAFTISTGDGTAGASERFIITSAGNVGIGTTGPIDGKLHVNGSIIIQHAASSPSAQGLVFEDPVTLGGRASLYYDRTNERLQIATFDDTPAPVGGWFNRMTFHTDTGNVGIGTTTPTEKLQVAGTIHSTSGGFKFPDGSTQTTAGGKLNFVNVLVYPNANAPAVFTDLDLSGVVGTRKAMVLLKVINNGVAASIAFRTNGDTTIPLPAIGDAAANIVYTNNKAGYAWVPTDSNGIVEWAGSNVVSVAIYLEAYLF